MKLGVCYYPEQWPRSMWASDARRMADLGLTLVRIGEFAWSEIEPEPGPLEFGWLEDAIGTLASEGLEVMLGTPTATPPKWLVDRHPDILALDASGNVRGFGSRRHYCFSSATYRQEAQRITSALAEQFSGNEAVTHWQTDNEFGCHDTTRSYSPAARDAFRSWLEARFGDIRRLNEAWGTVFWSQRYRSFSEIELPNRTVTEANPAHWLDFCRFSSDQVIAFHRAQADIIRSGNPDAVITHNVMGQSFDFDHFALGQHVDLLTWDSYPLGFLAQSRSDTAHKERYLRQGDPDFAAFHHDLYRGCAPFGVIEQQPGPVNWAPYNPIPLDGMVKLWGAETLAHGGKISSVFRWRQAPYAQEQNHAGLLRPDDKPSAAFEEIAELGSMPKPTRDTRHQAKVALVFDYETQWMSTIQPQGADWHYEDIVQSWYGAARTHAMDIDIVPPGRTLSGYQLVLVPSLFHVTKAALEAFEKTDAHIIFGPRSGSRDVNGTIPEGLAPGPLRALIPLTVARHESLPDALKTAVHHAGCRGHWHIWRDEVDSPLAPSLSDVAGRPVLFENGRVKMFTVLPDDELVCSVIGKTLADIGVHPCPLPEGLRVRRAGDRIYAFNYAPEDAEVPEAICGDEAVFLHGSRTIPPAGVAIWKAAGDA